MVDGKWIEGLDETTPLLEAARRVLTVRLGVVRERLPQAIQAADQDLEHVHQLRVGTRRAGAALVIFAPCLPDKKYRKVRNQLRQIRRAAGTARDWDVFLDMIQARILKASASSKPGLDFLLGYGNGLRVQAQTSLQESMSNSPQALDRLIQRTVETLRLPEPLTQSRLVDLARPLLTQLLKNLEEAASADLQPYEHLHQVRILGKRLRYAMELFEGCFAAPFREQYYPAVVEMQEILGQANDSYVASQTLATIKTRLKVSCPADWKRY